MCSRRAQLSLSLVEAAVGVLLLLGVVTGFLLAPPADGAAARQLDTYARDVGTVLAAGGSDVPPLADALANESAFRAARPAIRDRVESLLPAHLLYRVETPRGALGYPAPTRRPAGVERVPTRNGTVTVWVWYA